MNLRWSSIHLCRLSYLSLHKSPAGLSTRPPHGGQVQRNKPGTQKKGRACLHVKDGVGMCVLRMKAIRDFESKQQLWRSSKWVTTLAWWLLLINIYLRSDPGKLPVFNHCDTGNSFFYVVGVRQLTWIDNVKNGLVICRQSELRERICILI